MLRLAIGGLQLVIKVLYRLNLIKLDPNLSQTTLTNQIQRYYMVLGFQIRWCFKNRSLAILFTSTYCFLHVLDYLHLHDFYRRKIQFKGVEAGLPALLVGLRYNYKITIGCAPNTLMSLFAQFLKFFKFTINILKSLFQASLSDQHMLYTYIINKQFSYYSIFTIPQVHKSLIYIIRISLPAIRSLYVQRSLHPWLLSGRLQTWRIFTICQGREY